ncbi:hypothetical protein TNCV_3080551 [Trichonephila clavipes]|nr:hypothetical protein TNCV_3080551 [Trichonephila clavipes]
MPAMIRYLDHWATRAPDTTENRLWSTQGPLVGLILFFAVLAIASAQRRDRRGRLLYRYPVHRYRLTDDDQYFASLGGADVGRYSREQVTRRGWGGLRHYQQTEVSGVSLGKAKVGLYSRERDAPNVPLYG